MLHTMIENPYPTKAEISDISVAVLDGAAALMLAGETAVGAYPREAVAIMQRVANGVEGFIQDSLDDDSVKRGQTPPEVIGETIGRLCRTLPVTKVVAVTISGYAARVISNQRPSQPIIAVSNDAMAARSFHFLPGVSGRHVDIPFSRTRTDHIIECVAALWRAGDLVNDDYVLVASVGYPTSGVRLNHLQTHEMKDLVTSLGWHH